MSWQTVSAEKRSLRSQAIAEGTAAAVKNIHIDSIVTTNVYLQATGW
jgi:hypothetical protein